MLLPFEGMGVDTRWELRMPRAANHFDYSTIADVLITLEYTALDDADYRTLVLQTLRPTVSLSRPFSFRSQFADAWYDLHHPEQTSTPMTVRVETTREDFPAGLTNLQIQHVTLYFSRAIDKTFEVQGVRLSFIPRDGDGAVDGTAATIDGMISTRKGNGSSWQAIQGSPIGEWELHLPDTGQMRRRFSDEEIEDILLVITCTA